MAASKPKVPSSRQPHEIPLPASPAKKPPRHKTKGRTHHGDVVGQHWAGGPAAAGTSANAGQELPPWSWVSVTDESASRHPAVFSKDGSYFFSIVGSSVKIYSVSTGALVSTLSASSSDEAGNLPGIRTGPITSAILNPHNEFQLITGSLDGHIRVWDFLDGVLLQTVDIGHQILQLAAHANFKGYVFAAINRTEKKRGPETGRTPNDHGVVLRVSLRTTSATADLPVQKPAEVVHVGKTRSTYGLGLSASGSWLVAIGGHKSYVAQTSNLKAGFTKFVSPESLRCLTMHPTEEYFATGDDKGTIRLWYCLDEKVAVNVANVEKRAPTTTLHWHAHAVASLAFTHNGAYLLSGGEESVLVLWQLHTGKKEFVPRVGSPILSIAVSRTSEEEYLLGLADASFVFVNAARLKVSRSHSRIKLDPAISHSRPAMSKPIPLATHSPSSTLILPSSHPSSLQAFSPSASKLVSELEVSPSNRVSRRDESQIEPSRVERAIISSSGEWMATVDTRDGDESFRGEIYLKIWQWDKTSGIWTLNTRVDRPHGLKPVTAVAFSPASRDPHSLLLVTTGEDGNAKSWRIRTVKDKQTGVSEVFWVVRSIFTFRREIPRHASWSPDGSLLAVSFGPYVAIYDPVTNAFIHVLHSPETSTPVISAHFVGNGGRYLAAVGSCDVVLWDLVTQSALWNTRGTANITATVSHPNDETFVVFQTLKTGPPITQVFIYKATSGIPQKKYTLPFRLRNSVWYNGSSPAGAHNPSFSLVGITDAWSVVFFGDSVRAPSDPGSRAKGLVDGPAGPRRTLFQDIFGESAFADVSNIHPPTKIDVTPRLWNGKELADIFDAPAYLMPPLETLYDSLMNAFLQPRSEDDEGAPKTRPADEDGSDEEDAEMDVDEESIPIVIRKQPERVVDGFEMDNFIELFRQHGVKAPSSSSVLPRQSNGVLTQNGTHKGANGTTPAGKPKANGTPRVEPPASYPSPASSPSATPEATSAVAAGQKRKKSISS